VFILLGHILRVHENRVLRGIFGYEREEETGSYKIYIINIFIIFKTRCSQDRKELPNYTASYLSRH
jgi:hypothetical protein